MATISGPWSGIEAGPTNDLVEEVLTRLRENLEGSELELYIHWEDRVEAEAKRLLSGITTTRRDRPNPYFLACAAVYEALMSFESFGVPIFSQAEYRDLVQMLGGSFNSYLQKYFAKTRLLISEIERIKRMPNDTGECIRRILRRIRDALNEMMTAEIESWLRMVEDDALSFLEIVGYSQEFSPSLMAAGAVYAAHLSYPGRKPVKMGQLELAEITGDSDSSIGRCWHVVFKPLVQGAIEQKRNQVLAIERRESVPPKVG